jgi:hypothetical protein
MPVAEQAKTIEMNPLHYERLSLEHRDDHIRDYYHHRPGALLDLMQLPTEVELPEAMTDTEDIANYLSDHYGFAIADLNFRVSQNAVLLSRIITTFVTWIRVLFCSDDSRVILRF